MLAREKSFPKSSRVNRCDEWIQLELRACKDKLAEIPQDFFDNLLLLYVKAHVYTYKTALIDALEYNIRAFIREIPAEMLESVCQN